MKYIISLATIIAGICLTNSVYAEYELRLDLEEPQVGMVLDSKLSEYSKDGIRYERWKGMLMVNNERKDTVFTLWNNSDHSDCAINSPEYIFDMHGTLNICAQIYERRARGKLSLIGDINTRTIVLTGFDLK